MHIKLFIKQKELMEVNHQLKTTMKYFINRDNNRVVDGFIKRTNMDRSISFTDRNFLDTYTEYIKQTYFSNKLVPRSSLECIREAAG